MDIERQGKRKDVRDMPICKPSDPLPHIFDSARHSGFTTTGRPGVRSSNEAARDPRATARLRRRIKTT